MYKKIMVPLDGSELAECVLPHVKAIAGGCALPDIIFVRVVQPFRFPGTAEFIPSGQDLIKIDEANKADAKDYLDRLISRLELGSANLQAEVIFDLAVAESLADYASKNNVDLIVVATHGRSGVSRWVWGSVTDRILHSSCVPILMVRAPGCVPNI